MCQNGTATSLTTGDDQRRTDRRGMRRRTPRKLALYAAKAAKYPVALTAGLRWQPVQAKELR